MKFGIFSLSNQFDFDAQQTINTIWLLNWKKKPANVDLNMLCVLFVIVENEIELKKEGCRHKIYKKKYTKLY